MYIFIHNLKFGSLFLFALLLLGCRSPAGHRAKADRAAESVIERKQQEVFGEATPFSVERPVDLLRRRLLLDQDLPQAGEASLGSDQLPTIPHWPEKREDLVVPTADTSAPLPLRLDLNSALGIGARNNREYQAKKEDIYRAALSWDVEDQAFRNTYIGSQETEYSDDRSQEEPVRGVTDSISLGVTRTLRTGAALSGRLMVDLVKLLTLDKDSAYGLVTDMTISIPLLRGAGRHIVTEPLTQADRNVMYAMYAFEEFKRGYAVRVAADYFGVLQQIDQVRNAKDNFKGLELSAQRARRQADAGRLPEIQVDQALQEQLRARERLLAAQASYEERLDRFKNALGLPTDAEIELDGGDLEHLVARLAKEEKQEPIWADAEAAVRWALSRRQDLLTALDRVQDAQRAVTVAANNLKWNAKLTGSARAGSRRSLGNVASGDADWKPGEGVYGAGLILEAPWSRVAERNAYRNSFIDLERAVRALQEKEDQVKFDVRAALRKLALARESIAIQGRSVELAERRVESTELFLQAGRIQMRDVLDAQEALISARNGLTSAIVTYRVAELELQRDTAALVIDENGLWKEYTSHDN